jgi:hypothetical protein
MEEKSGEVELKAGEHDIKLELFENDGEGGLQALVGSAQHGQGVSHRHGAEPQEGQRTWTNNYPHRSTSCSKTRKRLA